MRLLGQFIYLFIYFKKYFAEKKHKVLFKYLNTPKSIIKHTSNFHITPRSIKKQITFRLEIVGTRCHE